MQYTQAQIDRANAVSLEDFLRTQGETLIKSGREYRWKEHDSLTVRGNKWFRHSQSKGGYPIDFVMEFYGKSFPEAVQLLTGESGEGQTEATTAPPTAFHLPLHNRTADRAIQYLCESRGLNPKLVEAFLLLQYIWTGKPGSQSGFPSISCLSYNERSNWLTITSLGFYVRRKDCQPSSCCSVRFEQVEPPDAGEFASHNRLNRQREKMDSGCRFLILEECE